jgi:microcystin-dependent protein
MGTPYLCELRLISWNYAPRSWAFCNGQTLAINQNQAIFALLGTTYGGNGQTTFLLPNLQGKVAMHFGNGFAQGQTAGETSHTLTGSEMPAHTHVMSGVNATQNSTAPAGHLLANTAGGVTVYGTSGPTPMFSGNVTNAGGSQPHQNEQPYLVMNWIIALQGIFPSRN